MTIMVGNIRVSLLLIAILVLNPVPAVADAVRVFVSILPQKFLVERIGGERVQVQVMVRPGVSAETYDPLPRQIEALQDTDVYFRIGVPFESMWINKIRSVNPAIRIIDCCEELVPEKLKSDKYINNDIDAHVYDAHVWTSPPNAIYIADIILQTLEEIDPVSSKYYLLNHAMLVQDLKELDEYIRKELSTLANRYFVVAHPSWSYFAEAYDLKQLALERHGTELRPREFAGLVLLARNNNVRTVYIEKQSGSAAARLLAREINADIVVLDPLAEDYIDNLKRVARALIAGAR